MTPRNPTTVIPWRCHPHTVYQVGDEAYLTIDPTDHIACIQDTYDPALKFVDSRDRLDPDTDGLLISVNTTREMWMILPAALISVRVGKRLQAGARIYILAENDPPPPPVSTLYAT